VRFFYNTHWRVGADSKYLEISPHNGRQKLQENILTNAPQKQSLLNICIGSTLDPNPYTLNPNPYTQNPNPYTLNPNPYALNPNPYTFDHDPYTLNPNPYALNPNPYTFDHDSYTLNPTMASRTI